jgi:plastocyanin
MRREVLSGAAPVDGVWSVSDKNAIGRDSAMAAFSSRSCLAGRALSAALFFSMAGGLTGLAGVAWGGTIKGTVRFAGKAVEAKALPVTRDQFVCGREKPAEDLVLSADQGIRHAVVSLQTPPGGAGWGSPLPRVQMDQQQCVFVPRVVVVPVGGTVEFLSSDRLLHNLHSVSQANPFNRTQPKGRTIPIVTARTARRSARRTGTRSGSSCRAGRGTSTSSGCAASRWSTAPI